MYLRLSAFLHKPQPPTSTTLKAVTQGHGDCLPSVVSNHLNKYMLNECIFLNLPNRKQKQKQTANLWEKIKNL